MTLRQKVAEYFCEIISFCQLAFIYYSSKKVSLCYNNKTPTFAKQLDCVMFEPMSLQGLAELDSERTLVLTVNNRYARRILGALSAQLGHQRGVIAIPDIMPLSAWLRQVADDMAFDPQAPLAAHLLDALAARAVWRQAIEAVESETVLLDVAQA